MPTPEQKTKAELRAEAEAAINSGVPIKRVADVGKQRIAGSKGSFTTKGMTLGRLASTRSAHGHHHSNRHRR